MNETTYDKLSEAAGGLLSIQSVFSDKRTKFKPVAV